MLTKRIIPCLDVTDGRVVKGVSFVGLRDAGDPVELAAFYDRAGADELVFLDITASSDGRDTMIDVVKRVSEQVFIPLTVGGGVRSAADVRRLLQAGADKVAMNTAAVLDPAAFAEAAKAFGNQCMVIAIDARRLGPDSPAADPGLLADDHPGKRELALGPSSQWEVYVHGGRTPTGRDAVEWAAEGVSRGVGEILMTSMDRDGTKLGYDVDQLTAIRAAVTVPIIASGGAGTIAHCVEVLDGDHADAVLLASVLHRRELSIHELKLGLAAAGIPVRLTPVPR